MGRALKVERKSENLPAYGKSIIVVLAIWNNGASAFLDKLFRVKKPLLTTVKGRRSLRGNGGFFLYKNRAIVHKKPYFNLN